jgi:hypothetical protein
MQLQSVSNHHQDAFINDNASDIQLRLLNCIISATYIHSNRPLIDPRLLSQLTDLQREQLRAIVIAARQHGNIDRNLLQVAIDEYLVSIGINHGTSSSSTVLIPNRWSSTHHRYAKKVLPLIPA